MLDLWFDALSARTFTEQWMASVARWEHVRMRSQAAVAVAEEAREADLRTEADALMERQTRSLDITSASAALRANAGHGMNGSKFSSALRCCVIGRITTSWMPLCLLSRTLSY